MSSKKLIERMRDFLDLKRRKQKEISQKTPHQVFDEFFVRYPDLGRRVYKVLLFLQSIGLTVLCLSRRKRSFQFSLKFSWRSKSQRFCLLLSRHCAPCLP